VDGVKEGKVDRSIDRILGDDREDPDFPTWKWRLDVCKGRTLLGYYDWLVLRQLAGIE